MTREMHSPVGAKRESQQCDASSRAQPARIRHLAVILDGNRRWAERLGLPIIDGYRAGGRNVHALLSWCEEIGIPTVTLWPLSTENLRRDADEVGGLLCVIVEVLDELADSGRWRLHIIGELGQLPHDTAERILAAERRTAEVLGTDVNIAIAYSGRVDILRAIRLLIKEHLASGTIEQLLANLDAELIAGRLYTGGTSEPDLVIRTSGEQRLSNFMLWQIAFSELYFTPTCWPDFDRREFDQAVAFFASRSRRFGR
jgi:short-chain Z-isoprenyl diphosphate synthase